MERVPQLPRRTNQLPRRTNRRHLLILSVVGLLPTGWTAPDGPECRPTGASTRPEGPVELRIAVNGTNTPGDETARFVIRKPGSYFLTGPLLGQGGKAGIDIAASHVTLDLRGFYLIGIEGALSGVRVRGSQTDVVIRDGAVVNWPEVGADITEAAYGTIEDIRAVNNGVGVVMGNRCAARRGTFTGNAGGGFLAGQGGVVEDCIASFNGGYGGYVLEASRVRNCTFEGNADNGLYLDGDGCAVSGCVALSNGLNGIASIYSASVQDSTAEHNAADGLWSIGAVTFVACRSASNGGDGIEAGDGSTLTACVVRGNHQDGLHIRARVVALDNVAIGQTEGAGIRAVGIGARIDGNTLTGNALGLCVESAGCLIVRNSASGNSGEAFQIGVGNAFGPIVNVAGVGDLSSAPSASHPLANLSH